MNYGKRLRLAAEGAALVFLIAGADAATLTVGPGKMFAQPGGAAAAAHRGDIIKIYPGTYGGAVWTKRDLIIEGMGGGATITGAVKQGKALFVISGANVTVKNLTFRGAKAKAGNGAGIRVENTGLSVENSRFIENQNGILTNNDTRITLSVTGSTFNANGSCSGSCAHAIYAGHIGSLTVRNSTFTGTLKGHHIKSRANVTTLTGDTIRDGATGTSSYLVDLPNGGRLTMTGNKLEKGPKSSNYSVVISLGEEGASNPSGAMLIANNTFRNDGRPTTFVRNRTGSAGLLVSGNVLTGNKTALLQGKGSTGNGLANAAPDFAPRFVSVASVPEPSSLALFGTAVLGALIRRRKAVVCWWREQKSLLRSAGNPGSQKWPALPTSRFFSTWTTRSSTTTASRRTSAII